MTGNPKASRWYKTPRAARQRKAVELTLSPEAHARLGELEKERGLSKSELVDELVLASTIPDSDDIALTIELPALLEVLRVSIVSKRVGPAPADWPEGSTAYKVTLSFHGRRLQTPFHQGSGFHDPPSAARVLHSLVSDVAFGEMSFADYCSELGYEEDSRKALESWKAAEKMAPKVRAFLGSYFDITERAAHSY